MAGMAEIRGSQPPILARFGKLLVEDMVSCSTKRAFDEERRAPSHPRRRCGSADTDARTRARYVTGELVIQAREGEKERARAKQHDHYFSSFSKFHDLKH